MVTLRIVEGIGPAEEEADGRVAAGSVDGILGGVALKNEVLVRPLALRYADLVQQKRDERFLALEPLANRYAVLVEQKRQQPLLTGVLNPDALRGVDVRRVGLFTFKKK